MTQSEVHTSLQITVAREFAKNYRLFHRRTRDSGSKRIAPEETVQKRDPKKVDYSGFS